MDATPDHALVTSPEAGAAGLRGPFRLAVAMLVVTTVTILWGAMTTSSGSGLAYTTWPSSDGEWMPESSYTQLPQFFEHFHRLFGATAGLCSLALVVWLLVGRRGDHKVRGTALFGLVLIITQGVIGGLHVLNELPVWTAVVHGTLAQLTLATFALIAYQLSARYQVTRPVEGAAPGAGRTLVMVALVLLVVQTVVGAIARHANSPHALWTHVCNAFVVFFAATIATAFANGKLRGTPGLRGIANAIIAVMMVQLALGFVALAIRNAAGKSEHNISNLGTVMVISVHVLLGALLTVLVATLAAHVYRATVARGAGNPASLPPRSPGAGS